MTIVDWDDIKNDTCLKEERGFEITTAAQCFMDPRRMISRDSRFDYGEDRFHVLGRIDERVFFVTYTLRAEVIRIVLLRKAHQRDPARN